MSDWLAAAAFVGLYVLWERLHEQSKREDWGKVRLTPSEMALRCLQRLTVLLAEIANSARHATRSVQTLTEAISSLPDLSSAAFEARLDELRSVCSRNGEQP